MAALASFDVEHSIENMVKLINPDRCLICAHIDGSIVSVLLAASALTDVNHLVKNTVTPPADGLKEILFNVPRVSFYGFLMALAKSESINESIGRLPAKAELLEGSDSELTSVLNVNTRSSVQTVSILSSSVQPVNNVSGNNEEVPVERDLNMNGTADGVPNVVPASNVPPILNQKNGGLGRSPIIRMKGGKLRLEHPVNHNQSGPAANQTGTQSARPTSAAGGENKHTGKGSLSQRSRQKKESSDESSDESDDDDTSSDTN